MQLNRCNALLGLLCCFALPLGACNPAPPQPGAATLADAAEGSESISIRHFSRQTVPCGNAEELARALLALTSRDLAEDARTRLLDYATDDVQLKDGAGKIAVIVYAVSGDDAESVVTTTEHFLVTQSCRVLHWGSAVTPGG